jgi:polyhydroxybutyrate depolymerase
VIVRLALLAAVALVAGCRGLPPGTERHALDHGGETRTYLVHTPPDLPPGPVPLVLVLHGAGGSGRQMEAMSGFSAVADREGFLAVYPDGLRRVWNDGRHGALTKRDTVDDVGFLLALLDRIAAARALDRARVYATGISNGGFLCYRLANDHADRFAAIAPVVTGLSTEVANAFHPSAPVAVFAIQGTEDPLVPYHGGPIGRAGGRKDRGRILGTRQALELWRAHDGCAAEPVREPLPDRDAGDGCTVERATWTGGRDGTAVRLDTIHGGGHTWPNGPQYLPRAIIGLVCRDYHASADIWAFFVEHGRAPAASGPAAGAARAR